MSTMKLTKRGKIVAEASLVTALLSVSVVFGMMFTLWLGDSVDESNRQTHAIKCAQEAVLQPDGSCASQER